MLESIDLGKVLFLDVETVPQYANYSLMPERDRLLWDHKAKFLVKENETPDDVYNKAGIYAEFGKVICISVGALKNQNGDFVLRIKSFSGDDEPKLLSDFSALLNEHYRTQSHRLCAHNGKEFDFPYLGRRILINGLKLPVLLDLAGKRPWEIPHIDTLELWKFGDYKHYISLDLMTHIFNIPTPKNDIDGSMIASVYWKEKNLESIVQYCQKDVIALVHLLLKLKGEKPVDKNQVQYL